MSLYSSKMEEFLNQIEASIPEYLPTEDLLNDETAKAMKYAMCGGGKRLRPVLLMAWAYACGANIDNVLPYACAIEMIHNYSLIHDDLPCMDDSELRHGQPSVHIKFGEDIALLAGDGLLTRAFEIMLNPNNHHLKPAYAMNAAYTLADAAGINGMVGGQNLDLVSEGKALNYDQLQLLQSGKTAALIKAACMMGAQIAGADEDTIRSAAQYGENIGLSFQIIDDVLDVTSTEETLGKPIHSDEKNEKNTMVFLLGIEKSKELAREYTRVALDAIHDLHIDTKDLESLAVNLIGRIN